MQLQVARSTRVRRTDHGVLGEVAVSQTPVSSRRASHLAARPPRPGDPRAPQGGFLPHAGSSPGGNAHSHRSHVRSLIAVCLYYHGLYAVDEMYSFD